MADSRSTRCLLAHGTPRALAAMRPTTMLDETRSWLRPCLSIAALTMISFANLDDEGVREHRQGGACRRSRVCHGVSGLTVRTMIQGLIAILRAHPEITFFFVLGVGYALGKLKVGSFSLGAVTGTLLAGVAVGQLGVQVSGEVKQSFFLLFSVLNRIQDRAAIFPWSEERRSSAGGARGNCRDDRTRRGLPGEPRARLRRGHRRGRHRGRAHRVRDHRNCGRCDRPASACRLPTRWP